MSERTKSTDQLFLFTDSCYLLVSSAGVSEAEELLLAQGDPFRPSVQCRLPAEEDLGCREQVRLSAALYNEVIEPFLSVTVCDPHYVLAAKNLLRPPPVLFHRDSMCMFESLWETFPDENCVLTNRESLPEVRTVLCVSGHHGDRG